MAQIDVSEMLCDPDFVDDLKLIHRTSVVGNTGENRLVETCEETFGSVQPASGKTISRLPDALRIGNMSSFWIKAGIVADSNCEYPDLIEFNGKRYEVIHVFDWGNWGEGWAHGVCVVRAPGG